MATLTNMGAPSAPTSPSKHSYAWRWEVISSENPNVELLREFHCSIIERYFLPTEAEEVQLWEQHCLDPPGDALCKWAVVVALSASPDLDDSPSVTPPVSPTTPQGPSSFRGKVAGGAVVELYYDSQCALMPYMGIDERHRGKGLAQELLRRCTGYLSETCARLALPPFQALFLEVLQARDEDHAPSTSGTNAKTRQLIWQRMNVEPIDQVDLIHPGRMTGGHRYHLAVFVGLGSPQYRDRSVASPEEIRIPVRLILRFIKDLFTGILRDEGCDSTAEYEAYESRFAPLIDEALPVGVTYWK